MCVRFLCVSGVLLMWFCVSSLVCSMLGSRLLVSGGVSYCLVICSVRLLKLYLVSLLVLFYSIMLKVLVGLFMV